MKLKLDIKKVKESAIKNKPITIVISIIVLGALLVSLFFYFQYRKTQSLLNNPTQQAELEAEKLVVQVGKLIDLPKNEKPTVLTVSDVTKLLDQPFFANAKNGDRVLIYTLANKEILFRQSENKIIEVAHVNLNLDQPTPTSASTNPVAKPTSIEDQSEEEYSVQVLNGTLTVGFATSTQKQIESSLPNYKVVAKGDAAKNGYSQTIVVNVSGASKTAAEKLAGLLNAKVESLPEEENAKSGVDFLVILGSSN